MYAQTQRKYVTDRRHPTLERYSKSNYDQTLIHSLRGKHRNRYTAKFVRAFPSQENIVIPIHGGVVVMPTPIVSFPEHNTPASLSLSTSHLDLFPIFLIFLINPFILRNIPLPLSISASLNGVDRSRFPSFDRRRLRNSAILGIFFLGFGRFFGVEGLS